MSKIDFLIVTGSYIFRTGLRFLLEELDATGKIFFAEEGDHAANTQADIVLFDTRLSLPASLARPGRDRPLLVGLSHDDEPPPSTAPYDHLLLLSLSKSELLHQLQKILEEAGFNTEAAVHEEKLSEREKTILRYVALGFTNKEIAEKLFISTHTVITHRKNITRKTGIRTVSGLTIYALLNNLIEMDELNGGG